MFDFGGVVATIMHVDMDSFYASVEIRRRPALGRAPMWVGGDGRGVVLSANWLAKQWGVEGGMPSARAKRLCPTGVAVRPDFDAYLVASRAVMEIFRRVVAVVETASIDEAYLDVTGALRMWGSAVEIGQQIRQLVRTEQQLPCSVGIGPNRLVAKMASKAAKPDGLREVPPEEVLAFLHPMPVEQLYGVGASTAERLHRRGIVTVGDLADTPRQTLRANFGPQAAAALVNLAFGRSSAHVSNQHVPAVGVGNQETFAADSADPVVVRAEILRVCSSVARRLRKAGLMGRGVTLSIRFADFTTASASLTLPNPVDTAQELYAVALTLYDRPRLHAKPVRRVGVRCDQLVGADQAHLQPTLGESELGWREAERAADRLNARFGAKAVTRAALARLPEHHSPIPPGRAALGSSE
ncbi:MAG: DNA polymerase IV [Propionicimonas sp.]|nr:DNA polymerase IV [Propionicimonas sp.]